MRAAKLCALAAIAAIISASATAQPARIVILPVVVHSAAADPTYVSRGLADMLSARLEQHGGVEVVRVDDPAAATSRFLQAIETGRKTGGDYVLFGSFTQFGDGASLDIQCAPLQGEADSRSIFIQSGSMGEIIPKLDELADKVARYLGGPVPVEASVAASTDVGESVGLHELRRRLEALEQAVFPPVADVSGTSGTLDTSETPDEGIGTEPGEGLPES